MWAGGGLGHGSHGTVSMYSPLTVLGGMASTWN